MQVRSTRESAQRGARAAPQEVPTQGAEPMGIRLRRRPAPSEKRNPVQLHEQYLVEKELAARLMHASSEQRATLYSALYEELYRRIPHHSQLLNKLSAAEQEKRITR